MKAFAMFSLIAAAAAMPLAAQQPGGMGGMMPGHGQGGMMQGQMMPGMDSMMAPMMRIMAFTPEHLLAQQSALHLSTDQRSQLTALRDGAKTVHDAAAQQATMHMREMEQVMQAAAPDTGAAKTHFDAAHQAMQEAMWVMVRSAAQARALLTDAQRKQVDDMAAHSMSGGMMMQH